MRKSYRVAGKFELQDLDTMALRVIIFATIWSFIAGSFDPENWSIAVRIGFGITTLMAMFWPEKKPWK